MEDKELGEHSRKTRNSDNEEERPFKKAKYVWQLKGKYHLKDSYKQSHTSDIKEGSSKDLTEEADEINEIETTNNNTLKSKNCNNCCLDTLIAQSNALLESEESSDLEVSSNNIDRSIYDEIPVTLVKPNPKNQDDYLHKWQARQVAKCFVDNTINSILEQWKLAPVDAADFVENCDNDEHVEDEGILMAIQSHGLQSGVHYFNNSASRVLSDVKYSEDYADNISASFLQSSCLEESALDNYENIYHEKRKNTEQEMTCDSEPEKLETFEMTDQMDFLSTAVSVAIQKKGLSSYSYG